MINLSGIFNLKMMRNKFLKEVIAIIIVLIAAFLSSRAMFHEGFFRTIDDITTVRIQYMVREFERGLSVNNFPVRLGAEMTHTYGYFFYLFYSPLVYYVGTFFVLLVHMSDIVATKAVYALPLIFGPLLFYWCSRIKFGKTASVIGSVLFSFFPYRGFDAYFRGGVGENWAIALLPGLFAGIFLLEKKSKFGVLITSMFFGLIIISHNISALLVLALLILYGIFFNRTIKEYWISLALGLGLAAFFFIPSVFYLSLIRANTLPLNTANIFTSLIPLKDLISFNFKYTPSQSYSPLFFYLISECTLFFIFNRKLPKKMKNQGIFWAAGTLFLYIIMAEPFSFFWQMSLPITRMLQFVWRVFILLSFSIPYMVAIQFENFKSRASRVILAFVVIYLTVMFASTFKPKEYSYYYAYNIDDTGPCATADFEDYFPIWVHECIDKKPDNDLFLTEPGKMNITRNRLTDIEGNYESISGNTFIINRYYFPGWTVLVDGKKMPIDYTFSKSGLIKVGVPEGNHTFRAVYIKTSIMWLADSVTILSLFVWIGYLSKVLYAAKKTI